MTDRSPAAAELANIGRTHLEQAENLLSQLERLDPPFGVRTVLEPVNELLLLLSNADGEGNLLSQVHPEPQVRDTAEDLVRKVDQVRTRFLQSKRIYTALGNLDQAALDPLARRATSLTRQDMRRAGVELADSQREHVRTLRDQLVDIEQAFSRNIRGDVRHIQLGGPDELNGLPPDYVASHPPRQDGTIRITTKYPDYYPFMQYAASESARRRLLHEFYNRAAPANLEVLQRMLVIRKELAATLGYASWADYVTEDRMAGSARNAAALVLHERDPHQLDTTQLVFELAQIHLPYELPVGTHFETSFDHMTSYSAAYYTYLWSQAIAKDLLTAFKNGLLDQSDTRRYRDLVLAPGGSRPAAELVSDFLGRPHSFQALAKWLSSDPG